MGSLTEQWRRMAIASRTCIKWELPAVMTTGRCNLRGRRHSTTHNKAPELVRGIREAFAAGLRSKMSRNGPGHAVVMVLTVAAVGYGGRQHSRQSETTLRSLHQRRERAAFRKGERGAQPAWLQGQPDPDVLPRAVARKSLLRPCPGSISKAKCADGLSP